MSEASEKRWQPLLRQWVIVATSSAERPWSGAVPFTKFAQGVQHDPGCYLCPGVKRAGGASNPNYQGVYAFDNDFASLQPRPIEARSASSPFEQREQAYGHCRVLCWSERHDETLATLKSSDMIDVARLWKREFQDLASDARIKQVLIFENKGTEVGVSNLHPHGQVYATDFVTDTALRMRSAQADYAKEHVGHTLLGDLLDHAHLFEHLIIERSEHCSVLVPYAARFPYETWIVPHRHVENIALLTDEELTDFAMTYQRQAKRYDVLFNRSAPNITLLHNAPVDDHDHNTHCRFHLVFQPPLRDRERVKYLAGFESGANNIINPILPELAAEHLRSIELSQ